MGVAFRPLGHDRPARRRCRAVNLSGWPARARCPLCPQCRTGRRRVLGLVTVGDVLPGRFPYLTEGESLCFSEVVLQPPSRFGVDRLSLSFPVASVVNERAFTSSMVRRAHADDDGSWTHGVQVPVFSHSRGPGKRPALLASVFVGLTTIAGALWGKVECNPSRLADPEGCSLLPATQVEVAAGWMRDVALGHLMPACDLQSFRVRRVDVATDLHGISDTSGYVWGLLNQKRTYARRQYVYTDPDRNRAQTLWAGSGAGGVRLYDCFAAHGSAGAPEGSLRAEVEARGTWVSAVVKSNALGRLTADHLWAIMSKRWDWAKLGSEIVSMDDAVMRVWAVAQGAGGWPLDDGRWFRFSPAKADRFLGMLQRESRGLDRRSCFYTSSEYAKIKAYFGVVAAPELLGAAPAVVGRLDLATATEIRKAA